MNQSYQSEPSYFYQALEQERPSLVRFCTSKLGDPALAEDVVQETLLEAWRKIESLRDPEAFRSWLFGIANNMSLRQLRQRGRQAAIMQTADHETDIFAAIPSAFDFEVELDRAELSHLLEQALELLPADTRAILIRKYLEDASNGTIADQLGISENVVAVRLHRGKLTLQKVLASELRPATVPFGLLTADDMWQETRIWCTNCGQRRLQGKLNADAFVLRCPACNDEPNSYHSQSESDSRFAQKYKTFRPALRHFSTLMHDLFQSAILNGYAPCAKCGRSLPLQLCVAPYAPPSVQAKRGLHIYCPECKSGSYETLDGLALNLPEGRAFFQAHPRIHTLPLREVEHEGVPAIVVSHTSVTGKAAYDVILKKDTYETLFLHAGHE